MTKIKIALTALLVILLTGLSLSAANPSAATVLNKSSEIIKNAPSLVVKFSLSEGSNSSTGTINLSGDKFIASIDGGITTWYDGTTQWVYNQDVDEITVSTPTPDELATINPFVIITSLQKSYASRHLKAPAGKYIIELVPTTKGLDIKKAVITFDSCYYPQKALVTFTNGHTAAINVLSIVKGKKLAQTSFRPDKKKYSKAEWIDLR